MYNYLEVSHGYGRKRKSIRVFGAYDTQPIFDLSGTSNVLGAPREAEFDDINGSSITFGNFQPPVLPPSTGSNSTGSNGGGNNGNGQTDGQNGNGNSQGNGTNGSGSFGNSGR